MCIRDRLCIIWIYSRKGNPLPTLKNQFFQVCFLVTFFAITSNIVSTVMLYHYQEIPLTLTWIVTTFYFVMTPLMGVFYFFYVTSIVFENDKALNKVLIIASVPAAAYLVFVLINPATKLLFDINPATGYLRGSLIALTYIIFYIYCFACLIPVSYTHLDVYKRQGIYSVNIITCADKPFKQCRNDNNP